MISPDCLTYYHTTVKFNQSSVTENLFTHVIDITETSIKEHIRASSGTTNKSYLVALNAITGWIAIRNAENKHLKG